MCAAGADQSARSQGRSSRTDPKQCHADVDRHGGVDGEGSVSKEKMADGLRCLKKGSSTLTFFILTFYFDLISFL